MSAYKYIGKTFEKQFNEKNDAYKSRVMQLRREPVILPLEKPTNLRRARELGYKAKQGFKVVRIRVIRGAGYHTRPNKGRRPKKLGINKLTRVKSKQAIAEERVARKYSNMEVLNSYWIAEDGQKKWFEVILIDPKHPSIKNDKNVSLLGKQKNRVHRGLTSAGKKSRGLDKKGLGSVKNRPSIRANSRKAR